MTVRLRPHHAPRFATAQPQRDPAAVTLPLFGYRQTRDYTCGFASALMVLHYYGVRPPAVELFQRLGTRRDGTRQSAIVRELRASGLRAHVRYDVDLDRLRREIDRDKLVIGYLADAEHWLVIYGYGAAPERVFVADPRPGEGCEQPWQGFGERLGGFGIVCSRPRGPVVARQAALGLHAIRPPAGAAPPHLGMRRPLRSHLRCEVIGAPAPRRPEPAQLRLPIG